MKKNLVALCFLLTQTSSLLSSEQTTTQIVANDLVAKVLAYAALSVLPCNVGDGSYHLMSKGHWQEIGSYTFNPGDIIITSKELCDRVQYGVHGDVVVTKTDPTNGNYNWSTIKKPGTVTLTSTFYHGHALPYSEKKSLTVK